MSDDLRSRVIDALVMTQLSDFAGTDIGLIEKAADAVLGAIQKGGAIDE